MTYCVEWDVKPYSTQMDEKWLYYNFTAWSIRTKQLCSRLYSIEIQFYLKNKNREPPFGELRGNVRI